MHIRLLAAGLALAVGMLIVISSCDAGPSRAWATTTPPEPAPEPRDLRLSPARELPPLAPPPASQAASRAAAPATDVRGGTDPTPSAAPPRLSASAIRARDWLRAQLGQPFEAADGSRAQLIDSYEDTERVGWTYDAAVATIALLAAGDRDAANQLLEGLAHLQQADGSWFFAYLPDRGLPIRRQRYAGAMAWAVMAAGFFEWETGDRQFAMMARQGIDYLLGFLDQRPTSTTYGAISLGPANPRDWSAEHNLDAYAALRVRARLDGTPRLDERARSFRRFVLETLWRNEDGYIAAGRRDTTLFLDPQTWSVLSFGAAAHHDRLTTAIATAHERLATRGTLNLGLGPAEAFDEGVNPGIEVFGFDDSVLSSIVLGGDGHRIGKVWVEGTEGMVMALSVLGRREDAARLHAEMARLQRPSGGLPYATDNADGMPTTSSVAATAWFLLNELDPARNPFRPDDAVDTASASAGEPDEDLP